MNTKFKEVRCTFFDEGIWYVDGWLTDNPDENGMVVAKINEKTFQVEYTEFWCGEKIMWNTSKDDMVLECVAEKLSELTAIYIRNLN